MQGYKKPAVWYRRVEESELDEWFGEQKERLEEEFYASKDQVKAKERFDHKYRKLITDYQHKQLSIYEGKMRAARLKAPFVKLAERKKMILGRIGLWFTMRKQAVKKWFFDQKVKRILKDKSDLYH
jgi:hypothetical protein